ncbi:MAG: hypothetical protein DCC71_18585 [Proteobacteria bacterium]|nr:MAG: hypothetical protein DCC71_18585 [Pseudomonadota bacterium]
MSAERSSYALSARTTVFHWIATSDADVDGRIAKLRWTSPFEARMSWNRLPATIQPLPAITIPKVESAIALRATKTWPGQSLPAVIAWPSAPDPPHVAASVVGRKPNSRLLVICVHAAGSPPGYAFTSIPFSAHAHSPAGSCAPVAQSTRLVPVT